MRNSQRMQLVNLCTLICAFLFLSCKHDTPSDSMCTTVCPKKWDAYTENSTTGYDRCGGVLTQKEYSCLSNDANCRDGKDVPLNGRQCLDQSIPPSVITPVTPIPTSPINPTPKMVRFRMIKVPVAFDYEDEVTFYKSAYPGTSADLNISSIKSGTEKIKLSYSRIAKLIASKDGLVNTQVQTNQGGNYSTTVYKSKFTKFTDEWQSAQAPDEAIKTRNPCGGDSPIRHYMSVLREANPATPSIEIITYNFDWSANLFSQHPAAKAYDGITGTADAYADRTGKDFTVITYLMDAEAVYIDRSTTDNTCSEFTLNKTLLEELTAEGGERGKIQNHMSSHYGIAMQLRATHTFPIALFLNTFVDIERPSGCEATDLFEQVISHEIGHDLISLGHDPRPDMWMSEESVCQTKQTLDYTPLAGDLKEIGGKGSGIVYNPEPVNDFNQQLLFVDYPRWIP